MVLFPRLQSSKKKLQSFVSYILFPILQSKKWKITRLCFLDYNLKKKR